MVILFGLTQIPPLKSRPSKAVEDLRKIQAFGREFFLDSAGFLQIFLRLGKIRLFYRYIAQAVKKLCYPKASWSCLLLNLDRPAVILLRFCQIPLLSSQVPKIAKAVDHTMALRR